MIKLQVIGNLGKDCIVNTVNGKTVINFNVAHSEKFRDAQGNQREKTIWVECAYWTDKTAVAPYLLKGQTVYVEGQPEIKTYTTSDGRNGASLTLRVLSIQLVGGKTTGNAPASQGQEEYNSAPARRTEVPAPSDVTEPIDDLPF
ncbi:MAG: single-stranded DNA-binding protein [Chitinophagaceae bacterium]